METLISHNSSLVKVLTREITVVTHLTNMPKAQKIYLLGKEQVGMQQPICCCQVSACGMGWGTWGRGRGVRGCSVFVQSTFCDVALQLLLGLSEEVTSPRGEKKLHNV